MRKGKATLLLKEKSILQDINEIRFIGKVITEAPVTNIGSEIIPVIIKNISLRGISNAEKLFSPQKTSQCFTDDKLV